MSGRSSSKTWSMLASGAPDSARSRRGKGSGAPRATSMALTVINFRENRIFAWRKTSTVCAAPHAVGLEKCPCTKKRLLDKQLLPPGSAGRT